MERMDWGRLRLEIDDWDYYCVVLLKPGIFLTFKTLRILNNIKLSLPCPPPSGSTPSLGLISSSVNLTFLELLYTPCSVNSAQHSAPTLLPYPNNFWPFRPIVASPNPASQNSWLSSVNSEITYIKMIWKDKDSINVQV